MKVNGLSAIKRLLVATVLLVAAGAAGDGQAFTGDLKKDPAMVVKAYLSLDMKGARLDAMSWETLRPYINWKREISWGIVVVIDDYEVSDDIKAWEVVDILEVWIPAKFKVLGTMEWEAVSFMSEPELENVRYHVKAVGDRWRIMEPILPPHVGVKRLINFVREAILKETESSRREKLEELLESLRKAKR
jgi:hypothetical protein